MQAALLVPVIYNIDEFLFGGSLHVVVPITTHTYDRRKSIGEKETKKRKEEKVKERKEKKNETNRKRQAKTIKRQEKQEVRMTDEVTMFMLLTHIDYCRKSKVRGHPKVLEP